MPVASRFPALLPASPTPPLRAIARPPHSYIFMSLLSSLLGLVTPQERRSRGEAETKNATLSSGIPKIPCVTEPGRC